MNSTKPPGTPRPDVVDPMDNLPARRCVGTNRMGEQCRRSPIPGGTVCVVHGGKAPQVQERAKKRLLALVEPVLDVFEEAVEMWRSVRCDKCGNPAGDIAPLIAIGKIVLDRSGFGPTANLNVSPVPVVEREPLMEWFTTEELTTVIGIYKAAERRFDAANAESTSGDDAAPALEAFADGVFVEEEPTDRYENS